MGLCLVGHHPIHSRGGYSNGPGPERFLQIRVPALSTTRPMGFVCLLTIELLSNFKRCRLILCPGCDRYAANTGFRDRLSNKAGGLDVLDEFTKVCRAGLPSFWNTQRLLNRHESAVEYT
jgi:hypothetical protein